MSKSQAAEEDDERVRALRNVDLFQDLTNEELEVIWETAVSLAIEKGEVVFEEGEQGNAFYILLEGAVEVLKSSGSDEKTLTVLRSGDTFGEMALLNSNPRSATARAIEPTRLLLISEMDFKHLLGSSRFAEKLMRGLSNRLRTTSERWTEEG